MTRSSAPSAAEALRSPVRRTIVEHLASVGSGSQDSTATSPPPGLSAHQVAEFCDLHVTTARFHLDRLVEAGLIESRAERDSGVGRPRKLYAVPRGSLQPVPDAVAYQMLARLLAENIGSGENPVSPEEAGRRWAHRRTHEKSLASTASPLPADSPGAWLAKIGRVIDILAEWGYSPNLRTQDDGRTVEVTLYDCPFLPLAADHPEVVCSVHRGLLSGTLEAIGEPDATTSLQPLVTSRTCTARLTTPTRFGHPETATRADRAQTGEPS